MGSARQGDSVVHRGAGGIGDHLVEHDVGDAFLVQDILDLVDHLSFVEDGLRDQECPLTELGDQLPDPVGGVEPENDASRDLEKDVRHDALSPVRTAFRRRDSRAAGPPLRPAIEKKAENPEGYLRLNPKAKKAYTPKDFSISSAAFSMTSCDG